MGMAASQVRIFQLLSRKNSIGCDLTRYANMKASLSRDMIKVTNEYQQAMRAKKLQWSAGSANYVDMSYSLLMTPNTLNANKPYLITEASSDRVVIDRKYKEYAEMISDGGPGNWEDCKYEVLSDIIGVSEEELQEYDSYYMAYLDNKDALYQIEEEEPLNRNSFKYQDSNATSKLLENMVSAGGISDWAAAYGDESKKISKGDVSSVLEQMKNTLSEYFMEGSTAFGKACDSVNTAVTSNPNISEISVKELVTKVLEAYRNNGGAFASMEHADSNGNTSPIWYDVHSTAYEDYKALHDAWEARRDEAKNTMETSLKEYNKLFDADIESQIAFYDAMFSTIAENGWVYYDEVSDPNYLNQMFISGMFNITTVNRELVQKGNCEYSYENTYNVDVPLNCSKMIQVSDTDTRDLAIVQYENKKRLINDKETRIDLRMKNLETEQAAINQMIQSVENTKNTNIEQHLNIFS